MEINPLKFFEKEYCLLIMQYLHLNPNGRTFEQICTSVAHHASPTKIKARIDSLLELDILYKIKGEEEFETLFALTERGRCASEVIWDLFRIILNPSDDDKGGHDLLDFYR